MRAASGGWARFGLIALLVAVALGAGALLLSSASPAGAQSGSGTVDYDTDGDNLIEVSNLVQLNAIRYDLDGNGTVASGDQANYDIAFPNAVASMGCAATCTGYELEANLDFDTNGSGTANLGDTYWNGGDGWAPIGSDASASTQYSATFDGDGHTISNLFISRNSTNHVGLFGATSATSAVRNVGLESANVTGQNLTGALIGNAYGTVQDAYSSGSVSGKDYVGGLVGYPREAIQRSYSSGSVSGKDYVGGLGGYSRNTIQRSYSTASVTGTGHNAGGLVAYLETEGKIKASYATGTVTGLSRVGGLVGDTDGNITASYSTGAVSGTGSTVGGLVGVQGAGTTTNSYWDTETSGKATSGGGVGKTTSELQSPTQTDGYAGIYANWNLNLDGDANTDEDPWDFGTASQYPALKAEWDGDGTPTAYEFGRQGRSAPVVEDYDDDDNGLIEVDSLVKLNAIRWDLDGNGASTNAGYALAFPTPAVGMGCPVTATDADDNDCLGYELTADLDFNTDTTGSSAAVVDSSDDYWNGGLGWSPIASESTAYMAVFDGGRHTIANLFINRPTSNMVNFRDANKSNYVGLFASLMSPGEVRHLRLTGVSVTGRGNVGAVVGHITLGKVSHVSSTGAVTAVGSSGGDGQKAGGLVGSTGANTTVIEYSYSTATVTAGDDYAGGLIGESKGEIRASYATGAATATGNYAGGLAGSADYSSSIIVSYATGAASGADYVGGLVGRANGDIAYSYSRGAASSTSSPAGTNVGGLVGSQVGTIIASYWDTTTSSIADDSDAATGEGKTTSDLQTPQAYGSGAAIYADWNVDVDNADNDNTNTTGTDDPWDFGTASQYPALKADFNRDSVKSAADGDFGRQPRAAPVVAVDYDLDDNNLIEVSTLAQLNAIRHDLDGNGDSTHADYTGAFLNAAADMGCAATCTGYELTADLDFDTHGDDDAVTAADTYWNGGAGWSPIGSWSSPLATTFDGAGHAIANLFINRGSADNMGLFGVVDNGGRIRNLGLEGVNITGRDKIGALAGVTYAASAVEAVYVTEVVSGREWVGGLIGEHFPTASLRNSYSAASVTGSRYAGGLLGYVPNAHADVYYSYARGIVSGQESGGLLFSSNSDWSITGHQTYWDTQTSGQATSNGGTGQTTSNLKTPTDTTTDMDASTVGNQNIYSSWPVATWDFGTASQYPALKYDTDGDGAASWQEFGRQRRSAPVVAPGTVDYDTDDDGLIEVDSLVKLNAVRWDLDGDGASTDAGYATAFPNPETGMGCPITATDADDNDCTGYELTADLDFDQNNDNRITSADAAWWNGGSGWEPIGGNSLASVTIGYPGFTATFQGNGHTISHLYIDRPGRNAVGLFGATKGRNSVIRNLTLADVNVASKRNVGALVGSSWGSIEGVHVSGRVSGDRAGGLVGQLSGRASRSHSEVVVTGGSAGNRLVSFGGLVSVLTGSVESSYATGSVTGTHNVGGLVGFMDEDSRVSRCYATGDVTVSVTNGGGLIGLNNSGSISACYATGEVSGNGNIAGGLVGLSRNPSGNRGAIVASYARGRVTATGSRTGGLGGKGGASVTNSYWDVTTSGIADDNNAATGEGKATSELQSPTQTNGYAGIYANWNLDLDGDANTDDDPWDFGTTSEYPALKADFNDDGISTWQEFGRQRRSAPVVQPPVVAPGTVDYDTDGDNLIEVDSLAKLNAMRWDADGDGAGGGSDYDAAFPDAAPGMGCPSACTGYELEADLNFDTNGRVGADSGDDYWNGGMGWAPFWYYGTFEGNRHTISNLYVNRPNQDYVGLFSTAGAYAEASEVRNVGLENVDVTGREYVGGLAGRAYGSVRRVYTTGEVNGEHYVGGLVGEARSLISETYSKADVSGDGWESSNVGGLVGYLRLGTVKVSYATGDVSGMNWVGGLVGHNSSLDDGGIIASYATGNLGFGGLEDADPPPGRWVDGFSSRYYLPYTPTWVGGLVGDSSGPIAASYSTGGHPISLAGFQPGERKDRSRRDLAYMMEVHWKIGGLVGKSYGGQEQDSYWDIVTSRHRPGDDSDWVYGKGKTTEELQWVTDFTGIYANWNVDLDGDGIGDYPWDLGSSAHYPTLKVDWNGDGTATAYEFGGQGRSLNDQEPKVVRDTGVEHRVMVPENTPGGSDIFGSPVPAITGSNPSYATSGPDWLHFGYSPPTGRLSVSGPLDYESRQEYRVTVTATAGGTSSSIDVIIEVTDVPEPPGAPTGVTIVPLKGSLVVSWTAPDMAGKPPLRIYEVTYYHDGDKAKITAAGTTTYTMTHLTPLTTYAVRVRARNTDGWGPDSAVAFGTPYWFAPAAAATGAEPGTQRFRRSAAPPGQPANLRATPQADGTALVTWDAPVEAGDDTFYRVRRRVDAADGSYSVIARRVEAAGSDGVVAHRDEGSGREAGQRYLYSVRAFDGDGKPLGRWTQGVRDNRPPAFAEDSAAAFQVAENTAAGTDIGNAITATDPDDGDSLIYLLGGADADHFAIDADSGQLQTKGALDYESRDSYAVTVIAADGAGLWVGLDATITVTDVKEAPRPGNVQAALQSDGSVLVTWQAPAGAGDDTFYRVRRRLDAADSNYRVIARRVEDTDNDGDAEYRDAGGDLEAGQGYIYSVRAFAGSGAKLGQWTEGVSVVIPAAAPAKREARAANAAPTFAAASTAVSVAENTVAGTNIGDAVAATDPDAGDSLTYTLGSTDDDGHFAIDSKTGQLKTSGALDYESQISYLVAVTASDSGGLTASIAVTITVDDVADTPPGRPDAPEIINIQQTSFRVTWTEPAAGSSAIIGYGIQYKLTAAEDSAYADVKPTPTGTVTGYNLVDRTGQTVAAGTSYDVQVRARNAEGWGPWSEAAIAATAP